MPERFRSERRTSSFQDLVELHPTVDYSSLLTPQNRATRKGRLSILKSISTTRCLIAVVWCFVLLLGEYGLFHFQSSQCSWKPLQSEDPLRILLIGDPQLTDQYSYSWMKSIFGIPARFVQFFSDLHMKKMYQMIQVYQKPDAVFIMGDLFDSGRIVNEKEYADLLKRFQWIFKDSTYLNDDDIIPKYYLSGNHDIGLDIDVKRQLELAGRFKDNFGPLNYEIEMKGISLVVISATTAEAGSSHEALFRETSSFIESKAVFLRENILPSILFHHVPLWRPPGSDCGPIRNRNRFLSDRKGYSYRNMLDEVTSSSILSLIKPFLTFSGDDHDYCKRKHSLYTTEHTIGTFSWLQGNPYPSFALASIKSNPNKLSREVFRPEAEVQVCFSPNQIYIYECYALLALFTIFFIYIDPIKSQRDVRPFHRAASFPEMKSMAKQRGKLYAYQLFTTSAMIGTFYVFLLYLSL